MVPICQPMQQSLFGGPKRGPPFIHKWCYIFVQVFNPSLLLHVTTFLQLCVINFSLIFDPSLPWKWWRHMWMTLILLNLKFVNWMAFHFLLENMLETLKFGSWPNFSRLSYMIGAFMICPCANLVHLSSYIYNIRTYFDIFLPRNNIWCSSPLKKQISSNVVQERKIIFTMKQWIPPSKKKERNYFKILLHLSYECLCSNLVL